MSEASLEFRYLKKNNGCIRSTLDGRECTFFWSIKNFSLCPVEIQEYLDSPWFAVVDSDSTKWKLTLYPKGTRKSSDSVGINLSKVNNSHKSHLVRYKFSLIDADGMIRNSTVYYEGTFEKEIAFGIDNFIKIDALFDDPDDCSPFLHQDTLTVRCDMKVFEKDIGITNQYETYKVNEMRSFTVFNVEECHTEWLILEFNGDNTITSPTFGSKADNGTKWNLQVKTLEESSLEILLHRSILTNEKQHVVFKITFEYDYGTVCYTNNKNVFFSANMVQCSALVITKRSLLGDNVNFYPPYKLSRVLVDLRITEKEKITTYGPMCTDLWDTPTTSNDLDLKKLSADIKSVFDSQTFCDATVKSEHEEFKVHKAVLCARSTVFCQMFENEMVESISNCINIKDIEGSVLNEMFLYMYTGLVGESASEVALELYVAADKYDLQELKEKCRCLIISNLEVDNACQIALLADLYRDHTLMDASRLFMHSEIGYLLPSSNWKSFLEARPDYASEFLLSV